MTVRFELTDWKRLWTVSQKARYIASHFDYYKWLQKDVREFLPHVVLVSAWGDFAAGDLRYDVASALPEFCTGKNVDGYDMAMLMGNLYQRWQTVNEECYILNNLESLWKNAETPGTCVSKLLQMGSALVHGIRDRRGGHDCLYVFFDPAASYEAHPEAIEMLVPQIDAALRRVECLNPPDVEGDEATNGMSDREQQVMDWVKIGKTNEEIGIILGISHNTVKNHLKRIFKKLDVSNRAQAVDKYKGAS
jgi:transcriptional regulator EpsA